MALQPLDHFGILLAIPSVQYVVQRFPKYSPIILDYSRIPGHTYYSQKDASIIYLSLVPRLSKRRD